MTRTSKTILIQAALLGVFCATRVVGQAQSTSGGPRLRGIVSLPDKKWAVVENPLWHPTVNWHQVFSDTTILHAGPDQLPAIAEVKRIESSVGQVTLQLDRTNQVPLRLEGVGRRPGRTMLLQQVSLDAILGLYAEISGRTVLRHPLLLTNSFDVNADANSRSAALAVLDRMLGARDIITKLDGDKFVLVVTKALVDRAVPKSGQIRRRDPNAPDERDEPVLTRYTFDRIQIMAAQYARLEGLQFHWKSPVPAGVGPLKLTTQSNLSKAEFGYALETLLTWQGVKVIPFGENQAKVIAIESE